ncbi:F-box/kelch-repeat protein [Nymphaea thermarum]|nr:F-box/kelch-repeat protein [Nymphaea thermarum]
MAERMASYELQLEGDVLEAVLSKVPMLDLVPASVVNRAWRDGVASALARPSARPRPWLFLHHQRVLGPSRLSTHAYDPNSGTWVRLPHVPSGPLAADETICASQPSLLYTLTPTSLCFSSDPVKARWVRTSEEAGLQVWRRDPAVAVVAPEGPSPRVVVMGGTWEFEEDALAVEVYDVAAGRWERCESLPERLKGVSGTTWQTAVSGRYVYVVERGSGGLCRFDVDAGKWGPAVELRQDRAVFHSSVVVSGDRVVLVGVSTEGVRLWKADYESAKCELIGQMPPDMAEGFIGDQFPTVSCLGQRDFIYMYNSSKPENIYAVDISAGRCDWEIIKNPAIGDVERMSRVALTCSQVKLDDVRRVFRPELTAFRA